MGSLRQLNPNDAVATLTAADVALVQAQVGTVASVVHGVRDKRDRTCNGGVCEIATRGLTCDQAVVDAANPQVVPGGCSRQLFYSAPALSGANPSEGLAFLKQACTRGQQCFCMYASLQI